MKKYILGAAFLLAVLVTPLASAQAASLSDTQVQAILSLLSAFGADQSVINNVQASLTGVAPTTSGTQAFCHDFYDNLTFGATDKGSGDVSALNRALMLSGIEPSGNTFDDGHAGGVVIFQRNNGIRQTGYVGPKTREKLNALYGCSNSQTNQNGQTMNVGQTPTITVTSPNGGEQFVLGKNIDFRTTWSSTNLSGNVSVYLDFADGANCLLGTALVSQGSFPVSAIKADGKEYRCPNILRTITAGQYKILLNTDTNPNDNVLGVHDSSNAYFTYVNPSASTATNATPTITSLSVTPSVVPNGGTATVHFTSKNTNYCHIYLDPGSSEKTLDEGYTASKGYADKTISTTALTAAGTHSILVYCWNSAGAADSKFVQFTVSPVSTAPMNTSTAAVAPSAFDTPSGTLSLTSSSCTIRNGYSDCTVSAYWSTTGVSSVTLFNSNGAVAIDAHSPNISGGYNALAVAVAYGGTMFNLKNTATGGIISSRLATASCESGTSWNTTTLKCVTTPTYTAPTLSVDSSTVTAGATINFNLTANGGTSCYWSRNGQYGGSMSNGSLPVSTTGLSGTYYLTATCSQSNGSALTSNQLPITVNAPAAVTPTYTAPTLSVDSSTVTAGATINFNLTNGGTSCSWSRNGQYGGPIADGSLPVETTGLPSGTYNMQVTCIKSGQTLDSNILPITVNAPAAVTPTYTAPTLSVDSSTVTAGATINFNLTANGGTSCYWSRNGQYGGSMSNGSLPVSTTGLSGTYYLTATCSQSNGSALTSNQLPITVNAPSPTPAATLDQPNQSSTVAQPTISGTATVAQVFVNIGMYNNSIVTGTATLTVSGGRWSGALIAPLNNYGSYDVKVYDAATRSLLTTGSLSVSVNTSAYVTLSQGSDSAGRPTLVWSTTSNATSCSYRVNASAWQPLPSLSGSTPLTGIGLTVGTTYTLEAYCLNSAGQPGPYATFSYRPTVAMNSSGNSQTASIFDAFRSVMGSVASQGASDFHYVWNNDLQIGSPYFADVNALQTVLTKESVYAGEATGGFYNQTFTAVKAFQKKYGIKESGYVGMQTRAKLNALYSN